MQIYEQNTSNTLDFDEDEELEREIQKLLDDETDLELLETIEEEDSSDEEDEELEEYLVDDDLE